MTKEQETLLAAFQPAIDQAEALKALKATPGWAVMERVLTDVRREALEDVLASGSKREESVFIRIGHAQAVNTIFNFFTQLVSEGEQAVKDREAQVRTIREQETAAQEATRVQRYYGHDGMSV